MNNNSKQAKYPSLSKTEKRKIKANSNPKIVVPETVYKEITAKEHDKLIFDKLEWIEVRSVETLR